jgi:sulfite dehydrogenase (quinone) subunit SoeB
MGFYDAPQPYLFQLYVEPMRRFQLAAEGHGNASRPSICASGLRAAMDPLPHWSRPSARPIREYPLHALTQRPMAMYHSWGSQNAWLRQIHGVNPLYLPRGCLAGAWLFAPGDWARVTSPHGAIEVPVAHMAALNEHTIWTWNAIGKRKGAWALDEGAPEATKGLPAQPPDRRAAARRATGCAGPIPTPSPGRPPGSTCASGSSALAPRTAPPNLPPLGRRCPRGRETSALEGGQMTALPETTERKLGLVIDLDTCVGCHACVIACKGWNTQVHGAPLVGHGPLWRRARGHLPQPHPQLRGAARGRPGADRAFPKSCLHCEDAPCVTVCPTGASFKREEDGIVLVNEDDCMGCGLCAWACPYGAREMDAAAGVMKKCTLCVDRIYNDHLPEIDRVPACVRTCPAGARHFGDLGDPDSDVSRLVAERGGFDLMPEQGTRPVNKYLPPRPRDQGAECDHGVRGRHAGPLSCAGHRRPRRVSRLARPGAGRLPGGRG